MFGIPVLGIVCLGLAILILLFVGASVFAEAMIPIFPSSVEYIRAQMEQRCRANNARTFWLLVAVGLCLLAVILAL